MTKKRIISLLLAVCLAATCFVGCSQKKEEASKAETTTAEITETTEEATETATEVVTDAKGEAVTDKDGKTVTKIVVKKAKKKAPVDKSANIKIILRKNGNCATNAKSGVEVKKAHVKITAPGDYTISSDTDVWHGKITVSLKNTEKASLRFENVNIVYNQGSILEFLDSSIKTDRDFLEAEVSSADKADDEIKEIADQDKAPNIDISFPTGTKSIFHSTANSYQGVIYNESKLTIRGNGNLNVESRTNADNCICSTKSITIKNLTMDLTTAANTVPSKLSAGAGSAKGIFSYNKVTVESGKLNIKTNGDGIRCDQFYNMGGTVKIASSSSDGIDSDDIIDLTGGTTTVTALEKSAFKVRRVNNTDDETYVGNSKVRTENGKLKDYFRITGGKVQGESKKMTTPSILNQNAILAKLKKGNATSDTNSAISSDDNNRLQTIIIYNPNGSVVKKSANKCTKLLYSDSKLTQNTAYKAVGDKTSKEATGEWNGKLDIIKISSKIK